MNELEELEIIVAKMKRNTRILMFLTAVVGVLTVLSVLNVFYGSA